MTGITGCLSKILSFKIYTCAIPLRLLKYIQWYFNLLLIFLPDNFASRNVLAESSKPQFWLSASQSLNQMDTEVSSWSSLTRTCNAWFIFPSVREQTWKMVTDSSSSAKYTNDDTCTPAHLPWMHCLRHSIPMLATCQWKPFIAFVWAQNTLNVGPQYTELSYTSTYTRIFNNTSRMLLLWSSPFFL